MPDVLSVRHEAGVCHLVLNRPERRNALSGELRRALVDQLSAAAADEAVGVVVLSGAGQHFCAGFDLKELAGASDPGQVFVDAGPYHHAVHTFPKPLIAAVVGSAVAGGMDLALMCDLRVAGPTAVFGQPQVRHGLPALHELVTAVVGDPMARDLCLTGRLVDATEGLRIGLVQRLVDGDPVRVALEVAADIAAGPDPVAAKRPFLAGQPEMSAPSD